MKGTFKLDRQETKSVRNTYQHWRNGLQGRTYILLLFAMSRGICPFCERKMFISFDDEMNKADNSATVDHVNPLSKTREHSKAELQILCKACNLKKGNKY